MRQSCFFRSKMLAAVLLALAGMFPLRGSAQTVDIRVSLSSQRTTYRVGEAITLRVELRNLASSPIYVSQHLDFVDSGPAGVNIEFFGADGQPIKHSFADSLAGPAERANPSRLLLFPGAFYGIEHEALHLPKKAGRYKVVATYFDFTSDYLSEEEKKKLGQQYPVFSGGHKSKPLDIVITK